MPLVVNLLPVHFRFFVKWKTENQLNILVRFSADENAYIDCLFVMVLSQKDKK